MKDQILLPEQGFYKANLHCHSTCSDGKLTPEELKEAYQQRGYSIIAYTDHRKYRHHQELTDRNFLALAACEIDLNENAPEKDWTRRKTYHFNLIDTDPQENFQEKQGDLMPHVEYGDKQGVNEYLRQMGQLGFLTVYNHPYWSLQTYEEYGYLQNLFAMEIYNHGNEYGFENGGLDGFQPQAYDEMLRSGQRIFTVAADDDHNSHPFTHPLNDSFGGFVQIAAEELSYPAVITALKAGKFYWSMGPELRGVTLKDDTLIVDCSPVETVFLLQEGRRCGHAAVNRGETMTHAEFPLTGKEGWFRVELRDGAGRYAGTNAYFIDQLL